MYRNPFRSSSHSAKTNRKLCLNCSFVDPRFIESGSRYGSGCSISSESGHGYGSGTGYGSGSGSGSGFRGLKTKNWRRKKYRWKSFSFFDQKPGLLKGHPCYRRSIQPWALQNMKFITFFLFFVGHFCTPGSDPDCESGSGSRDPIESGSNPFLDPDTDLDSHHC